MSKLKNKMIVTIIVQEQMILTIIVQAQVIVTIMMIVEMILRSRKQFGLSSLPRSLFIPGAQRDDIVVSIGSRFFRLATIAEKQPEQGSM